MHSVLCVPVVKWQNYTWCSLMSLQWSDRTMHSVLCVPAVKWQNYAQYSLCPCSEVTELCTVFCVLALKWQNYAQCSVCPCSEVTEPCTVFSYAPAVKWQNYAQCSVCPCSEVTELCTVFCYVPPVKWQNYAQCSVCTCSEVTELCTVFCVYLQWSDRIMNSVLLCPCIKPRTRGQLFSIKFSFSSLTPEKCWANKPHFKSWHDLMLPHVVHCLLIIIPAIATHSNRKHC